MPRTCLCVEGFPAAWQAALHQLVVPAQVASVLPAGGTPLDRATTVLATIRYRPDPATCDTWCNPAATLASRVGDCDDMVILGLSCLAAAALHAYMAVGVYGAGDAPNHVWIEGEDAQGWFLFETTNGEVHRGTRPAGYQLLHRLDPRNATFTEAPLAGPPGAAAPDVTTEIVVGVAVVGAVLLLVAASREP